MNAAVGIVGLGLMGVNIATRFLSQGYTVVGYDTDQSQCLNLEAIGGTSCRSLLELPQCVEVIVLSLPNGAVSEEVCLGVGGIVEGAQNSRPLIIDTTTARPSEASQLAMKLSLHGFDFLDVGLSGSGPMIARGDGLGVVGGAEGVHDRCLELLDALCGVSVYAGPHGSGMTAKLVINFVMYVNRLALAEGLILAENSGVSPGFMLGALRRSAAKSAAMEIWGERMVSQRYDNPTSRIKQHVKDVRQIVELARDAQLNLKGLPLIEMVADVAVSRGYEESDNSIVIEVLRSLITEVDTSIANG